MAISEVHYRILKQLREDGTLPACESILNIGQPNWYGDMLPLDASLELGIEGAYQKLSPIEIAACFYRKLFEYEKFLSVDGGGDDQAIKADLNYRLVTEVNGLAVTMFSGSCPFDLIVNHGTAEHVFDIAQVFRTMHDHCKVGGHMIHESPWTGWIDHGFYSLHPTLFYDLAAANEYDLKFLAITEIERKRVLKVDSREHIGQIVEFGGPPNNAMLFVVLQKTVDGPFLIPQQGVYAGTVSDQVKHAWRTQR